MAVRTSTVSSLTGLLAVLLLVLVGVTASLLPAAKAEAQEQQQRRGWFLRDLFQPRSRPPRQLERLREPPAARQLKKRPKNPRKQRQVSARKVQRPAEPVAPVVEKQPDARIVIVVGDFLGNALAEGLTAIYADNPRIKIVDRTSGSSGLVRNDVVDWPTKVVEIIATEKPVAIVVMLGANDRQQMRVGDGRETLGTEGWSREYASRAAALATSVRSQGVPLVWVGLPAFKSAKASNDMLAFNGIFKEAVKAAGGEFIDVWEGFVDENGAFVSNGPDVNGQPAKLRAGDGINFTRAGKRKLAFYVEKPVDKLLGVAAPAGTQPGSVGPAIAIDPAAVPTIETTVPISLDDPELDGGAELLGAVAEPKKVARTPGERLAVEGLAPDATPGRADDFTWPPRQPARAAAPASPSAASGTPVSAPAASPVPVAAPPAQETTTAIRP